MQRAGVRSLGPWDELSDRSGQAVRCLEVGGREGDSPIAHGLLSPPSDLTRSRHLNNACWYVWTLFTAVTYCTAFHLIDKLHFIYFLMDGHLTALFLLQHCSEDFCSLFLLPCARCSLGLEARWLVFLSWLLSVWSTLLNSSLRCLLTFSQHIQAQAIVSLPPCHD